MSSFFKPGPALELEPNQSNVNHSLIAPPNTPNREPAQGTVDLDSLSFLSVHMEPETAEEIFGIRLS